MDTNNDGRSDIAHSSLTSAQAELLHRLYTDIRQPLRGDVVAHGNFTTLFEELQTFIEAHPDGQCDNPSCYDDFSSRCRQDLIINGLDIALWQMDQADLDEERVRQQQVLANAEPGEDVYLAPNDRRSMALEVLRCIQDYQATYMDHTYNDDAAPPPYSNHPCVDSAHPSPALQTFRQIDKPDEPNDEPNNEHFNGQTNPGYSRVLHLYMSAHDWFEGDRGAQDNMREQFYDILFEADDLLRDLSADSDALATGLDGLLKQLIAAVRAVTLHQITCSLRDEKFIRDAQAPAGKDAGEFEEDLQVVHRFAHQRRGIAIRARDQLEQYTANLEDAAQGDSQAEDLVPATPGGDGGDSDAPVSTTVVAAISTDEDLVVNLPARREDTDAWTPAPRVRRPRVSTGSRSTGLRLDNSRFHINLNTSRSMLIPLK